MRRIILVFVIVAIGSGSAEARRFHFHHYGWGHIARNLVIPPPSYREQSFSRRRALRSYAQDFPPTDWQLQRPDPNWEGRRYVSPAGDASLAFYASSVAQQSFQEHVNAVAFADGEQVLSLNADRRGLLVTGTKDAHIFLRQARLACGDRQWHHIALDFPANEQRSYMTLIAKAMRVLAMADTGGCDTPTAENER
jgi:hypothetical protein